MDRPRNRGPIGWREWSGRGAPANSPPPPRRAAARPPTSKDAVATLLERHLEEAGFTEGQVASARALWADYRHERAPRVKKPEVLAAALHLALAFVLGERRVTKASIARRYGVAPGSVSSRYADIRDALLLRPGDPRYGA